MTAADCALLTGAAGFVGREVIAALTRAGWQVKAPVRAIPVARPAANVEWIEIGDFTQLDDWAPVLGGVKAVVHLAGRAHVMNDSDSDPIAAYRRVNVGVTERLASAAAAAGVRRFVFMSSVKAGGEVSGTRALTEDDMARPLDAYGISKREAEEALIRINRDTGMPVTILRPPLVYGPGVRANFLRLMRWVDRGVPLPFGAVDNRRSLVYVGNLADAILAALQSERESADVYFVSDSEDLSTAELIRRLGSALERQVRLVPVPPALLRGALRMLGRGDEAGRLLGSLCVDTSRIRNDLGWRPPYSVTEGLAETARAYRQSAASAGLQ